MWNSAKALLEEIGLKDTNGDGVREWTDGPQKGQPVVLQLLASEDAAETQSVAEALVNQWAAVGIKMNTRMINSTTGTELNNTGNWDIADLPRRPGLWPAVRYNRPHWRRHQEVRPITGRRQAAQLHGLRAEVGGLRREVSRDVRRCRAQEDHVRVSEDLHRERVSPGCVQRALRPRSGQAQKNIPVATPTFLYTWVEDAILLEQIWTPSRPTEAEPAGDRADVFSVSYGPPPPTPPPSAQERERFRSGEGGLQGRSHA